MQRLRQCFCEFGVLRWLRRDDIHCAAYRSVLDRAANDPSDVLQRDPRHPLLARTEPTSRAQLERKEHLCQRAAMPRQNNSKPRQYHANPQCLCFQCLPFPLSREPR